MKLFFRSLFFLLLLQGVDAQSLAINKDDMPPDPSGILDIKSSNQGILVPRVANTDAVNNPANGLLVFDQSAGLFKYYNGNAWQDMDTEERDKISFTDQGNSFVGINAGAANSGNFNTGVGHQVLFNNISGNNNTAVGDSVLYENAGNNNTATGRQALRSNVIGAGKTAHGYQALIADTSSTSNTATGSFALQSINNGQFNIAHGFMVQSANTSGSNNVAFGNQAMKSSKAGNENIAVGFAALPLNDGGNFNIAVGYAPLALNITGSSNIGIGAGTLSYTTNQSGLIAVGDSALHRNGQMTTAATEGIANIAIGNKSMLNNTGGSSNIAIGYRTLLDNTTADNNSAIGAFAMATNKTGEQNVACGFKALSENSTGSENTAVGYQVMSVNFNGGGNTAVGKNVLQLNTEGSGNTAIGYMAMSEIAEGRNNTALGAFSFDLPDEDDPLIDFATIRNSTAIGYAAPITDNDQVRFGNENVTSIGGFANWTNLSDARFKRTIRSDVPGLSFVKRLRPVTYHLDMHALTSFLRGAQSELSKKFNTAKGKLLYSGFLAQEIEQAAQEVSYDCSPVAKPRNKYDHYGLRYAEFVVPLVKAVQELEIRNQVLLQKQQSLKDALLAVKERQGDRARRLAQIRAALISATKKELAAAQKMGKTLSGSTTE